MTIMRNGFLGSILALGVAGMALGQTDQALARQRAKIDALDARIIALLNERARVACEVGLVKKAQGVEVYQPDREKQVLEHVRGVASEGPLGPDAISRLFERIIDEARRLERRVVHGEAPDERRT